MREIPNRGDALTKNHDPENPPLTEGFFSRAIDGRVRRRLLKCDVRDGSDIVALRRMLEMSQSEFAAALQISVRTLQQWEQNRTKPAGPALALISIAARHPHVIQARGKNTAA